MGHLRVDHRSAITNGGERRAHSARALIGVKSHAEGFLKLAARSGVDVPFVAQILLAQTCGRIGIHPGI